MVFPLGPLGPALSLGVIVPLDQFKVYSDHLGVVVPFPVIALPFLHDQKAHHRHPVPLVQILGGQEGARLKQMMSILPTGSSHD